MHCPREAKHDSVRRQAWAILALVNLCISVGAQTSPRPSHSEEIVAVKASEEAFRKAQLTYDKESAGSILADEFVGTWNHGEQVTKKQFLSAWPRYWTWRMPVRKVRLEYLDGCPVYFFKKEEVYHMLETSGFKVNSCETIGQLFCVDATPV